MGEGPHYKTSGEHGRVFQRLPIFRCVLLDEFHGYVAQNLIFNVLSTALARKWSCVFVSCGEPSWANDPCCFYSRWRLIYASSNQQQFIDDSLLLNVLQRLSTLIALFKPSGSRLVSELRHPSRLSFQPKYLSDFVTMNQMLVLPRLAATLLWEATLVGIATIGFQISTLKD